MPISITVLKDNSSLQEPNQFSIVEQLFDSIFEKLDEAIDMKKGLLNDTEEVIVILVFYCIVCSSKGFYQSW